MADFSIWDQCQLNSDLAKNIDKISESLSITNSKLNVIHGQNSEELKDAYVNSPGPAPDGNSVLKMNSLQAALEGSEESCRTSLTVLDDILKALDDVSGAFYDITSRTNSLMANCENLLEEQHSLQQTVDMLKVTLEPFNGIEDIARSLGIPLEATRQDGSSRSPRSSSNSNSNNSSNSGASSEAAANLDPRSPEFQELLTRISASFLFLRSHKEIRDCGRYLSWLEKLQNRATSLVAKSIRELLEKASRSCVELHQQKLISRAHSGSSVSKSGGPDDSPIESAAIYQKFRGLSFRVRELTLLLRRGDIASAAAVKAVHGNKKADTSDGGSVHVSVRGEEVVNEIKLVYVQIRNELLLPFARDTWLAGLNPNPNPTAEATASSAITSTAGAPLLTKGAASLCSSIRLAYATLLRITQLEQQLFESLFNIEQELNTNLAVEKLVESGSGNNLSGKVNQSSHEQKNNTYSFSNSEVLSIIESISNATRDFLRPYIIREASVDELCKVVSTLSEDVRSQMSAMPVPKMLLQQLLKGLDGTVNDAKERLSYCAETRMRLDIQVFEPLHSNLAYPDILEAYQSKLRPPHQGRASKEKSSSGNSNSSNSSVASAAVADVYETWYPPMRSTLSLLSKLYGVVEMAVFEDFARRSIDTCVGVLRNGSEKVKKSRGALHGDLFLVRHLLILREQLVPFEIRLQGVEKHLDFSPTGLAFNRILVGGIGGGGSQGDNGQRGTDLGFWYRLVRFDNTNLLLEFARTGLPGMSEQHIDGKKDLDVVLKNACFALKQSAIKMLLGSLEGFLNKVTAFVGEIPIPSRHGGQPGQVGTHTKSGAKSASPRNVPTDGEEAAFVGDDQHKAASESTSEAKSQYNGYGMIASHVQLLAPETRTNLKQQAFMRPERMKEMLEAVQAVLLQAAPDLRAIMKLYIESPVARNILLKPILQEYDVYKKKMECVIMSCVDPGQLRRDVEQLLQTVSYTVVSELSH